MHDLQSTSTAQGAFSYRQRLRFEALSMRHLREQFMARHQSVQIVRRKAGQEKASHDAVQDHRRRVKGSLPGWIHPSSVTRPRERATRGIAIDYDVMGRRRNGHCCAEP